MLRDRDLVPNPRKKKSIKGLVLMVFLGAITAFLLKLLLNAVWFFPVHVPTSRMEPAYKAGDKVYINRRVEAGTVKKGDVLLVQHPAAEGLYMLRRVIGLKGDKVHLRDGIVYVNDVALNTAAESKIRASGRPAGNLPAGIHPRDNTIPVKVPPNQFYLLADNRAAALDSRVLGTFDAKLIVGRVMNW